VPSDHGPGGKAQTMEFKSIQVLPANCTVDSHTFNQYPLTVYLKGARSSQAGAMGRKATHFLSFFFLLSG
jgi:hypothetical protein